MSVKFSLKINFREAFGEEKYYSVVKSKSWHSDYIRFYFGWQQKQIILETGSFVHSVCSLGRLHEV